MGSLEALQGKLAREEFAEEIDFAFTTIHLQGRDPWDFIPRDALIVKSPS